MTVQRSFSDLEQDAKRKRTRREVFLDEMSKVVPWTALEALIEPHYPRAVRPCNGRDAVRDTLDAQLRGLVADARVYPG